MDQSVQSGLQEMVMWANDVPEVEVLLVTSDVPTEKDLNRSRLGVRRAGEVIDDGTCAIPGGVANLSNRHEVREELLAYAERQHLPYLLRK